MGDVVELVKSMIDPGHMISGILLDGRELEDNEWQAGASRFDSSVLEVETCPVEEYTSTRLRKAPDIVASCFMEFRTARKSFQSGDMKNGNKSLIEAVGALKSFFEWYGTLLQLMSEDERKHWDITNQIEAIADVCKKICQQQLYQSWWALGESLKGELEPSLDQLEDILRKKEALTV